MIAKRKGARKQQQTSRREKRARRGSAPRRSANTPKRENVSSVRQPRQKSRAATRQANPHGGKGEVAVGERVSPVRAMSSHQHEQRHPVGGRCTNLHTRLSQGHSIFNEKKIVAVVPAVAPAHQAYKRSLFASLEAQQEVEVAGLLAEEFTVPWLVRHEQLKTSLQNNADSPIAQTARRLAVNGCSDHSRTAPGHRAASRHSRRTNKIVAHNRHKE